MKKFLTFLFFMVLPSLPVISSNTQHPMCLQPEDICIVSSLNVPNVELSYEDLFSIYTLFIRHWDTGAPIRLAMNKKDSITHKEFVSSILGVTVGRYQRDLNSKVFDGRVRVEPKEFKSELELLEYIAMSDDVIGYVSHDTLDQYQQFAGSNTLHVIRVF